MADTLTPLLASLLECGRTSLTAAGRPEPGLVHLAPGGEVAWDNCCEGQGQLWVRLVQITPYVPTSASNRRTSVGVSSQACGIDFLTAVVGLGVMRCVHSLDDSGQPPTAEEMTSDTEGMLADQSALLDALVCCFQPPMRLSVTSWMPLGPLGGCAGGEWTASLMYDPCVCRSDE